jgi:CheY-like chemotaxis protein
MVGRVFDPPFERGSDTMRAGRRPALPLAAANCWSNSRDNSARDSDGVADVVGMASSSPPVVSVLVADDARDLQALIAGWLEEAGHQVTAAFTGREIGELVQQRPFDVVVTDILMPDGDGWDAIAEVLRLRPTTRIIAMSGGSREMPANAVLRVARGAGAIEVLKKPFTRVEFMAALGRVVRPA